MTELDTILKEISGLRDDVREDTKSLWAAIEDNRKCQTKLKLADATLDKEIVKLKLEKKMSEEAFIRHVQNQGRHFQPYFNETYIQKMSRKRQEIGTSITLGGIIFGVILAALKYVGWIG